MTVLHTELLFLYSKGLKQIAWSKADCLKMYLQSESLYFTGGGSNFFSERHFTEKREIGVSSR